MAVTPKILGQVAPTNTSNTDLYTVPAGYTAVISTLAITNTNSVDAAATVYVRKDGATAAAVNTLIPGTATKAGTMQAITIGITVDAGDIITVKSSVANALTFQAFGSENN